ncbi:radical SAM protein [bacterium]|nr:radical SAM protein [bacterium]
MIVKNFNKRFPDYEKILENLESANFLVNFKKNSISISLDIFTVLTYDLRGFLIYGIADEITFKRGLGNRFLKIYRENAKKQRFDLTDFERKSLLNFAKQVSETCFSGKAKNVNHENYTQAELENFIQKINSKNYEDYEELEELYKKNYSPVMILPPDQYLALVVQMTVGCSYNKCSFCSFYKDVEFKIKPVQEVKNHIFGLKNFLGEALKLRKSIFLGDANSLLAPTKYLVELLDFLQTQFEFGRGNFSGVYAFVDNFTQNFKTKNDYQKLAERNFKRAYIGFETGSQNVLRLLNKPATPQDARDVVNRLKESGISVGVILMTGVGGKKYFDEHIEKSVEVINQMNLDSSDIVYFSEFVSYGMQNYLEFLHREGIEDNAETDSKMQTEAIKSRLFENSRDKPKLTKYEIEEFIY